MTAIAPGYNASRQEVEDYIRQAATERGIDPEVAMTVYKREGAGAWQSAVVKDGVREPSWGPFQLYTGGGMGNDFQRDTGKDPSDPNTWREGVNYALDKARTGGWGPWYGAKAAGITGMMGINGQPGAPRQATAGLLPPAGAPVAPQASAAGLLAGLTPGAPEGQQQPSGLLPPQPQQPQQQPETDVPSLSDLAPPMRRRQVDLKRLQAMLQRPLSPPWRS